MSFDELKERYEATLLGRIKLKIFERITGRADRIPNAREYRLSLLKEYKSNLRLGRIFFDILNLKSTLSTEFSTLKAPNDIKRLIADLEAQPLPRVIFIELQNFPNAASSTAGALIRRERLDPSGYFYVITLLDEVGFPEAILGGVVEVRCFQEDPEPVFSINQSSGFKHFGLDDWENEPFLRVILSVLTYLEESRRKPLELELRDDRSLEPPHDPKLLSRLLAGYSGRIPCYKGMVPLKLIQPYNYDFCIDYPKEVTDTFIERIKQEPSSAPMTVYWKKNCFVMSDDYPLYLAHRKIKSTSVPVVILGEFPEHLKREFKLETGGPELIPPVYVMSEDIETNGQNPKDLTKGRLYAIYMILAELIIDPKVKEKKLHDFLREHPLALGASGSKILSEVRLGNNYRVDLILQIPDIQPRARLIELERADHPIFTKDGRPRKEVTHAIQQVEDWLRWWRENPNEIPTGLDPTLQPEGIVVIGKSRSLSEDDKRRLAHLNSNRAVKVVTYDELLDQLGALIRNLENASSDDVGS